MRIMILLLCVSASASCSLCRSYCAANPVVKVEYLQANTTCLTEPPPVEQNVAATVDATCPPQFALCLDVDAGQALEHNIRAFRRYNKEMWIRCSAPTDGGTHLDGGL